MDDEDVIETILDFYDNKTIETFACLKVYFRNLTIEQIQNLNNYMEYDDLICMVESKDKIIMSVFVHKYLKPYFNKHVVTQKQKREIAKFVFDIENNISKITKYDITDPGYPRKLLHHLENSYSIVDDAISKIYIDKNYPENTYPILKFGELDIDLNQ